MTTSGGSSAADDGGGTTAGRDDGDGDSSTTGSADSEGDADTGESSGDSTGQPPPSGICPAGPFADTPLPDGDVSATVVEGTSSDLYAGGLVEGPVWIGGELRLSHFAGGPTPASTILRLVPGQGLETSLANSGSNGLAVDIDGSLLAATHDDGALTRYDPDTGARSVVAAQYNGARFNSPNDIAVRGDGTIYFTDPTWQAPSPSPQPVTGVYRVETDGTVTLVDGTINMPNGISLSPDGATLYVSSIDGVVRYTVEPDGSVPGVSQGFGPGVAGLDGMAMDCAGNLYVTVHGEGQVRVLDPTGTELGRITVAGSLTNAAFGGDDGQTLYLTAGDPTGSNSVYTVQMPIPGYPF